MSKPYRRWRCVTSQRITVSNLGVKILGDLALKSISAIQISPLNHDVSRLRARPLLLAVGFFCFSAQEQLDGDARHKSECDHLRADQPFCELVQLGVQPVDPRILPIHPGDQDLNFDAELVFQSS